MREVPALARGLRILDLLATRRRGLRVTEIAAELDLPRSATYELVYTLRVHRAVDITAGGEVVLGSKLFMLGSAYADSVDLAQMAASAAEAARARADETVQAAILDGAHVLYVAKAESTHPLRLVSALGRKLPAQCTGLGKVLLAFLPDDEYQRVLEQIEWVGLTPNSITDPETLGHELERIREQEWAFDDCESNADVSCIAAPVRDRTGAVIAAMSVSTLATRMSEERREELRRIIVEAADDLSTALGYSRRHSALAAER
jgi:IclR family transcriptional regulator, KDG regulon repressor